MRNLRRVQAFLVALLMSIMLFAVPVLAATVTRDGLEVTLTTDKEEYAKGEQIVVTLEVTNTNMEAVTNVSMESFLPEGYELAAGNEAVKQLEKLEAGESASLVVTYVAKEDGKPSLDDGEAAETGESAGGMIWAVLVVLSGAGIVAVLILRRKEGKKFVALLLSFVMVGVGVQWSKMDASAETIEKNFQISDIKSIDGKQVQLTANVCYLYNVSTENGELEDTDNNGIPDEMEVDTDHDELPDAFEQVLGTDIYNNDTDGDGLPDGFEFLEMGTNPLLPDTDENGVDDGQEDADHDGVTNLEEYLLKTNPNYRDTDYDNLDDYQEIYELQTNPLEKDSDWDGLDDANEIVFGMNPLNPDTLDDGVLDGNRVFHVDRKGDRSDNGLVLPDLSLELMGSQIASLSVDKVENSDVFLNNEVPGYIGNAYDLNVDGEFTSATLSFEIAPECFANENFIPRIYYWDEDSQLLVELENQVQNGNVISATLTHFSRYIILSKQDYEQQLLQFEILPPSASELENKTFDVEFVLDESGSISDPDFALMKSYCSELIDSFADEDEIGIILFDDGRRIVSGLTNKEEAKNAVLTVSQRYGGTALYDAIGLAVQELSKKPDSSKIVIALTDGQDNSSSKTVNQVKQQALNNNVIIYTVGIGSEIDSNILRDISEGTKGQYYTAENFSALSGVFDRIIVDADLYKDTDEDGISDYHEKMIANGKLKTGTGVSIAEFQALNFSNPDSDSDDLWDGEELEVRERTINGKNVCYAYLCANPCLQDTDGDSLVDALEIYAGFNPLFKEISNSSGMNNNARSNLKWNSPGEWARLAKDLAEEFWWGFLHRAVQLDIQKESVYNIEIEKPVKAPGHKRPLRIDLYSESPLLLGVEKKAKAWEVKPASYYFDSERQGNAIAQLEEYVALAAEDQNIEEFPFGLVKGGAQIPNGTVTELEGYYVEYENLKNGIIVYSFFKKKPSFQSVPEQQRQEVEEKKPYKQKSFVDLKPALSFLWGVYNGAKDGLEALVDYAYEFMEEVSQEVADHIEEIIATATAIGGVLGALYLITNLAPFLVLAAV